MQLWCTVPNRNISCGNVSISDHRSTPMFCHILTYVLSYPPRSVLRDPAPPPSSLALPPYPPEAPNLLLSSVLRTRGNDIVPDRDAHALSRLLLCL